MQYSVRVLDPVRRVKEVSIKLGAKCRKTSGKRPRIGHAHQLTAYANGLAIAMLAAAIFALLLAVFAACYFLLRSSPCVVVPGAWLTSFPVLLFKALLRSVVRPQGVVPATWTVVDGRVLIPKASKSNLTLLLRKWRLDPSAYVKYCRVCDYATTGRSEPTDENPTAKTKPPEPFCFMETQFMRHFFILITAPDFPINPFGLIHTEQKISVRIPTVALLSRTCDLHCSLMEMYETKRGISVLVKNEAVESEGGRVVWAGLTTLLSRNVVTQRSAGRSERVLSGSNKRDLVAPFSGTIVEYSSHEVMVTRDTGLRYAAATGDYHPHHLYRWSAKLIGYPSPMAHGMWTLAKALAVLQEEYPAFAHVPLEITASFKRPLFMPSKVLVHLSVPDRSHTLRFEVRSGANLHLTGRVKCSGDANCKSA